MRMLTRNLSWTNILRICAVLTCTCLFLGHSFAQVTLTSGTILGTMKDPTGAVIVGAEVTAENLETGFRRSATTNDSGNYTILQLPVGSYRVSAKFTGFKTAVVENIVLQVNQKARVDLILELGDVTESVEVTAAPPLMDTDTAEVGEVIGTKQVEELPLNGRNFLQLALLVPGTVDARGSRQQRRTGAGLSANGLRPAQNTYSVDGIDGTDYVNNFYTVRPNVDAIQEFKVLMNLYDAEFGRTAGAQINVVTKSGTNRVRGSLFNFWRNDSLDARNFFNTTETKDPLVRNQFGGTLGFPIKKDKTFGFVDYQNLLERRGVFRQGRTPTQANRGGDLSDLGKTIKDPLDGGNPFPDATIPSSRLDPTAQRVLQEVPLPNAPDAPGSLNYQALSANEFDIEQWSTRVDHVFSDRDSIFGRFYWANFDDVRPGMFPGPAVGNGSATVGIEQGDKVRNVGLSHTHTFNPTTLNELRLGYNWKRFFRLTLERDQNWAEILGIQGPSQNPRDFRMPFFNITGWTNYGAGRFGFTDRIAENFQITNTLSLVRGNHVIKVGFDGRRTRQDIFSPSAVHGQFRATGRFTGDGISDFLMNFPERGDLTNTDDAVRSRANWISFYAQDDWQIRPTFTLNLGLRYDYFGPLTEIRRRMAVFDVDRGELIPVGTEGISESGYTSDLNNFGPRFGFAYRPMGWYVLRGGYGIFYSSETLGAQDRLGRNPPWVVNSRADSSRTTPTLRYSDALSGAGAALFPSANSFDQDAWRDAYIQHFTLMNQFRVQRDLVLELGYVATRAVALPARLNLNQPLPGAGSLQPRRPFPDEFSNILSEHAIGSSTYHSLQVKLEKRLSAGLSFLTAYTWGKSITDVEEENAQYENVYSRRRDRGVYRFDVRHRLSWSFSYELPLGRGKRFGSDWGRAPDLLLGGWQVVGILNLQSGLPFDVRLSRDPANTGTSRRPDRIADGRLDNPTLEKWFDPAAFAVQEQFTFGSAGRNIMVGPGLNNLDFSVFKNFVITEGHRIQFRGEFFNLTNTPHFNNPANNISVRSQVGVISSAFGQREIQLALKYLF